MGQGYASIPAEEAKPGQMLFLGGGMEDADNLTGPPWNPGQDSDGAITAHPASRYSCYNFANFEGVSGYHVNEYIKSEAAQFNYSLNLTYVSP